MFKDPRREEGSGRRTPTGETAAEIDIDWRVIPEEFVAMPGVLPPPTELDPRSSQRFAMYDGHFRWKDGQQQRLPWIRGGPHIPANAWKVVHNSGSAPLSTFLKDTGHSGVFKATPL